MTDQNSPRILVVDDEVTQRMLMKEYLEAAGCQVRLSEDGRHGLKMATSLALDLIIVDALLPTLDGYAVCTELRQNEKTAHLPIILVTASKEPDAIARGLAAGATDFINKPVDWQFLADRVDNVLESAFRQRELEEDNARLARRLEEQAEDLAETILAKENAAGVENSQIEAIKNATASKLAAVTSAAREQIGKLQAELEAERQRQVDLAREVTQAEKELQLARALLSERSGMTGAMHCDDTAGVWAFAAAATRGSMSGLRTIYDTCNRVEQQVLAGASPNRAEIAAMATEATVLLSRSRSFVALAEVLATGDASESAQVHVAAIVDDVAKRLLPMCAARGSRMLIEIADPHVSVRGDAGWLRIALLGLAINAVQHCPKSCDIALHFSSNSDGSLDLGVKDGGPGMAPGDVECLNAWFECPTFPRDGVDAPVGYGLSVAATVARAHGGSMKVFCSAGGGTSAMLTLPSTRVVRSEISPRRMVG